ncbi:MAG: hypothetical protein COV35_07535 [Alphaproteobacteria bacterium CG11_big_fil_rev_8_21_14_0_20_39_49]|nr:MAG: hypothetical protein COV35_07535 [Alphaproteobacteria bacterium CG11_big_fil_rev_8_21_14_0_20_39_49]
MSDNHLSEDLLKNERITNIILDHWNDIKGLNHFPKESDLDTAYLEPLLDNCFLIDVEGIVNGKYNYKFIGKSVLNSYGSDLTKVIDIDAPSPLTQKDKIMDLLHSKRPVIDDGSFKNINGDIVRYHQCLMPLSIDGYKIDSIFGGMFISIHQK